MRVSVLPAKWKADGIGRGGPNGQGSLGEQGSRVPEKGENPGEILRSVLIEEALGGEAEGAEYLLPAADALLGERHANASSIRRITLALHPPDPLEAVDRRGGGAGGQAHRVGQLARRNWADPREMIQTAEVGPRDLEEIRDRLVEMVDVRRERPEFPQHLLAESGSHAQIPYEKDALP